MKKAIKNLILPVGELTLFEKLLWGCSVLLLILSFFLTDERDPMTLISSLVGVTALIFIAKGLLIGQVLGLIFATFYGIISFFFQYYGETMTYLFMSAPIAVVSIISWAKNPYRDTAEVKVANMTRAKAVFMIISTTAVTVAFYFILKALGNANLIPSTISIATSFAASYLTFCRSPWYALVYALNDVVLIILWTMATFESVSYFPMIICFAVFLVNDVYAFYNWRRMKRRQNDGEQASTQDL